MMRQRRGRKMEGCVVEEEEEEKISEVRAKARTTGVFGGL